MIVKQGGRKYMNGQIKHYLLDIPCILSLIVVGFIMEFLIELPFIILCTIDGFAKKRNIRKSLADEPEYYGCPKNSG